MPYLTAEPSADVLGNTDWHRHISADDVDGLAGSSHRLWRAANDARGKGDDPEANVLNVVGAATSLMLTDGAKPVFQPLMNLVDRGRSPALEDFGPYDVVALAAFATTAPTAALRARLADVAATAGYELGVKEWKSGILAAHAYLELAESHLLTDRRHDVLDAFKRGLQLAWIYCRSDEALRDRYWALLLEAIADCLNHGAIACALSLISEVIERRRDLGAQVAPILETYANQVAAAGDHDNAGRCFAWAKKLWYAAGNVDEGKRCHLREGHHLVARADGPGLAMVRAHWLAEGIDVLRKARAPEAQLSELQIKLGQLQRYSMNDFQVRQREIDVSDTVNALKETLVGPSLFDSLMQICFLVAKWPDPDAIRRDVTQQSRGSFLDSLFAVQHVDHQGKVVGTRGAFDPNDEVSVEQAVVHRLREYDMKFRGETLLVRCASHLFTFHHPSMFQIGGIVEASPMIPPGHKESVARGLLAGINGDWLETATYLIPKVEPILRHYFQARGINTLIARDGTQAEMIVSDFLEHPQANEFLSAGLVLELKALLTHKVGYCLRHQWAHGLSDDDTVVNAGTLCLWWTLWRLILIPWADDYLSGLDKTGAHRTSTHDTDGSRDKT